MVAAQNILTHVSVMVASQGRIVLHLQSSSYHTHQISTSRRSIPTIAQSSQRIDHVDNTLWLELHQQVASPFDAAAAVFAASHSTYLVHRRLCRNSLLDLGILNIVILISVILKLDLGSYPESHRLAIPTALDFPD